MWLPNIPVVSSQTGVFHWSRDLQGIMLSAFLYGYTVTMPFGGLITSRFGPHRVLFTGILIRGLVVTLTPGSALLSPYLLIAVEVVRGIVTVRPTKEYCPKYTSVHCEQFPCFHGSLKLGQLNDTIKSL